MDMDAFVEMARELNDQASHSLSLWLAFKEGKLGPDRFLLPEGLTAEVVVEAALEEVFEFLQLDVPVEAVEMQVLQAQMLHVLVVRGDETEEGAIERFCKICPNRDPQNARETFGKIKPKAIAMLVEEFGTDGKVDMTDYVMGDGEGEG